MPYAPINGQRIWFEDSGGNGPAVVLAHGFLMDQTMFDPQLAALAPEFRVITWDERGFGRTEFDGMAFSYWDSARDCVGLLDHLGIERGVIGGMSQGGFLTLRAALKYPERIRGLVLIDTQSGIDSDEVLVGYRAMIDTWTTYGPVDELANAIAGLILGEPTESARWIAKWRRRDKAMLKEPGATLASRDDISDLIAGITCPAIVFHGSADTAISIEHGEHLRDTLGGRTEFVRVEGAGHAANLTHPDQVNGPLLAWLRSIHE